MEHRKKEKKRENILKKKKKRKKRKKKKSFKSLFKQRGSQYFNRRKQFNFKILFLM
jgi:hypothetical protein